jgi:hypothetical protein
MTVYNIDIIVRGEGFEFETLYFDEQNKGLIVKEWNEKNIYIVFERMKNNYLEVIKYLNYHTVKTNTTKIEESKHRKNKDFTLLISETEDRVKDCIFYQDNLLKNYKEEGFNSFFTNEFYRLEQDNHIVQEINTAILNNQL